MLFSLYLHSKLIEPGREKRISMKKTDTKIRPEDHLDTKYDFRSKTLFITTISDDPVAQGKALLQYYEQGFSFQNDSLMGDINKIIFTANNKNIQSLSFYKVFSLSEFFTNRVSPKTEIEIRFSTKENTEGILDLVCNTDPAFTTPYDIKLKYQEAFKSITYLVPVGTKAHLLRKINRMQSLYEKNILPQDKIIMSELKLKLASAEKENNKISMANIQERINAVEARKNSFRDMRDFVKNRLKVSNNISKQPELRHIPRSKPISQNKAVNILKNNAVLNNVFDEELKLFYSKKTKTLHLIDAGNPSTADNIKVILETAKQKGIDVSKVYFHVTHFHEDHVKELYNSIETTANLNCPTYIDIPSALGRQFIGSFIPNLEMIEPLIRRRKAKIFIRDDDTFDEEGEIYLLPSVPEELKHFIVSRGYLALRDEEAMLFTGDWNSFTPFEKLQSIFKKYYQDQIEKLNSISPKKLQNINLFSEIGHFPGKEAFFDNLTRDIQKEHPGINIRNIFGHKKNPADHRTEIISKPKPKKLLFNDLPDLRIPS